MCNVEWNEPKWDQIGHRKHRKSNPKHWERSLTTAMTGDGDETAQFDPAITDQQIQKLEMDCVAGVEGAGTLIRDRCKKRTYYIQMNQEIGASAGKKTNFIFVEYVSSGFVHGRPITWDELKKKGVG